MTKNSRRVAVGRHAVRDPLPPTREIQGTGPLEQGLLPRTIGGNPALTVLVFLLLAAGVLLVDYFTGRQIQFPILYVLPIGLAAWYGHAGLAYGMSLTLPLVRIAFYLPWQEIEPPAWIGINALIRVMTLVFYAYLVARTATQTRTLQRRVKVMEGFLPICAACKRIRNETGAYENIEDYVSRHSEAQFTHGLCPKCAKRLYPDFLSGKEGDDQPEGSG